MIINNYTYKLQVVVHGTGEHPTIIYFIINYNYKHGVTVTVLDKLVLHVSYKLQSIDNTDTDSIGTMFTWSIYQLMLVVVIFDFFFNYW